MFYRKNRRLFQKIVCSKLAFFSDILICQVLAAEAVFFVNPIRFLAECRKHDEINHFVLFGVYCV